MGTFDALECLSDGAVAAPFTRGAAAASRAERETSPDSSAGGREGRRGLREQTSRRGRWELAGPDPSAEAGIDSGDGLTAAGNEEEETDNAEDGRPASASGDRVLEALEDLQRLVPSLDSSGPATGPQSSLGEEDEPATLEEEASDRWLNVAEFHAMQANRDDVEDAFGEDEEDDEGPDDVPEVLRADASRSALQSMQGRRRILYGTASLVLLVGLAAQYAWFMPDDMLRRYPQSRALLETLCPLLGCAVPEVHDAARFELVSRDVRVHPRYEGALLVTAALVNSAGFVQPYPRMQFTLFNVNGQSIASRIFAPSEYLGAGVDEAAGMEPQTPLQITLDVLAPDEPAVSFEFRFL
jgi:hypothetical protein